MNSPYSPSRWAILSFIILGIGLVWIGWSRVPPETEASLAIAPQAGFLAPEITLTTLEGNTIRLSDLRGQPVLINFWASWCPPCKAEMPAVQRVQSLYQDQGFVVLAINATQQDTRETAEQFIKNGGYTFQVLLDTQGEATRSYQIHSLPTSFFIDAQGMIKEVVVGGPMAEALLRIRVEQLLEPSPGGRP